MRKSYTIFSHFEFYSLEGIIMDNAAIERAKERFGQIVIEQLKRVEEMKKPVEWVDYAQYLMDTIVDPKLADRWKAYQKEAKA